MNDTVNGGADDCSHIDYIDDDELSMRVNSYYSQYEFRRDLEDRIEEDAAYRGIIDKLVKFEGIYRDVSDFQDDGMSILYRRFRKQNWERRKADYIRMLDDPRNWDFIYPDQDGWGLDEVIRLLCKHHGCIPDVVTMESFLGMMYREAKLKGKQTCLDKWEMMHVCRIFDVTADGIAVVNKDEILSWLEKEKSDVMILNEDGSATTIRKIYRKT